MEIAINTKTMAGYRQFLKIRQLPVYKFRGEFVWFPDEYADRVGAETAAEPTNDYTPSPFLMDYQAEIVRMSVRRRKFCVFADCGLGKTLMFLDYIRHVLTKIPHGKCALIVSPVMVIGQTITEAQKFYGDTLPIERVPSGHVGEWLRSGTSRIGITNYEALTKHVPRGRLGCLVVDESSMLKSHYGKWGTEIVKLGKGLRWKWCGTGTPAPNDRIEYANHGVLMDAYPTINSFLAKYFVNRGQTDNRWEIKPHAVKPFYRDMAHWCIFLTNPSTYGWHDNTEKLPPINVHIHDVDLTEEQRRIVNDKTGELFVVSAGGIMNRTRLAGIAKGHDGIKRVDTHKPKFIADLIASWPDESTIVWCLYNREQRIIEEALPGAQSMDGDTPLEERLNMIAWFKGEICTCELQRRNGSTCEGTTVRTSTNGVSEHPSSKPPTTRKEDGSTLKTKASDQKQGRKLRSGSSQIQENVLPSASKYTGLLPNSTTTCLPSKEEDAQFADANSNTRSCSSIIATEQVQCEDYCARGAISQSDNLTTTQRCLNVPPCTCDRTKGRTLISKARLLGFGLNLQVATRQVFSGLQDSYENFYQAVKRSNRYGSTRPLNVHIPITEIERPMIDTVLAKAKRVQLDAEQIERSFHDAAE